MSRFRTGPGAGVDLDDVFDPYVQGDKVAPTGFTNDGVDLCERYAPLRYGSAAPPTGLSVAGRGDFNTLWAAKGSATYTLGFDGATFAAHAQALSSQGGTISADASVGLLANGTWAASGGPNFSGGPAAGLWLPAGASVADFEARFLLAGDTWAASNSGAAFMPCSQSPACGVHVTIDSATTQDLAASVAVECQLRRISTGTVTVTRCTLYARVTGQA